MWLQAIYLFLLIYCFALSSQWSLLRAPLLAACLWVLACSTGYLVPLWAMLPAMLVLWLAERSWQAHKPPQPLPRQLLPDLLTQSMVYVAFATISLDNPPLFVVVASWLLHLTLYAALKLAYQRLQPRSRLLVAYAFSGLSVITLAVPLLFSDKVLSLTSRVELSSLPFLSLRAVATPTLVSVALAGGTGWTSAAGVTAPESCALVLHGADRHGSRQAASQSLIAALHAMKVRVLAVDHPGYGQSPVPQSAGLAQWNPALLTTQALAVLRRNYRCPSLDVYGHSMGASEAIRLATNSATDGLRSIRLLGAGTLEEGPKFEQYWYGRFHQDRRLAPETVSFPFWRQLTQTYYDNLSHARALSAKAKQAIDFIAYDNENSDLAVTRELLWAELGNPPRLSLPMTHYFNAVAVGPILVLDTNAIAQARRSLLTL